MFIITHCRVVTFTCRTVAPPSCSPKDKVSLLKDGLHRSCVVTLPARIAVGFPPSYCSSVWDMVNAWRLAMTPCQEHLASQLLHLLPKTCLSCLFSSRPRPPLPIFKASLAVASAREAPHNARHFPARVLRADGPFLPLHARGLECVHLRMICLAPPAVVFTFIIAADNDAVALCWPASAYTDV